MIYQPDTLRVYDYSLAADIMMNCAGRSDITRTLKSRNYMMRASRDVRTHAMKMETKKLVAGRHSAALG